MKDFIHQARVRRDVVVKHILAAKARKHRAYVGVDEASVRQRAVHLPEDGVPEQVCKLLSLDADIDKLQTQKAATPVEGRSNGWTASSAE